MQTRFGKPCPIHRAGESQLRKVAFAIWFAWPLQTRSLSDRGQHDPGLGSGVLVVGIPIPANVVSIFLLHKLDQLGASHGCQVL